MTCKFTKDTHDWVELLSTGETDWSLGHEAWWCKSCGVALTQSRYDGRKFDIWSREPRITKNINSEEKTT